MYEQYRDYIFNQMLGFDPSNWKAALESLPRRGFGINPKPGEITPLDAPHHGISIMIDAGGNARGRVWLPTDNSVTSDGNEWFTHEFQVIADGPTPGSFIWAWIDKGGATVRPFVQVPSVEQPGATGGVQAGPTPPPTGAQQGNSKIDDLITAVREGDAAIIAKLDELKVSVIKAAGDVTKVLPTLLGGGLFGRREQ